MSASTHVVLAYGFFWAAVAVYVIVLARRQGRMKEDLAALRARLEREPRS